MYDDVNLWLKWIKRNIANPHIGSMKYQLDGIDLTEKYFRGDIEEFIILHIAVLNGHQVDSLESSRRKILLDSFIDGVVEILKTNDGFIKIRADEAGICAEYYLYNEFQVLDVLDIGMEILAFTRMINLLFEEMINLRLKVGISMDMMRMIPDEDVIDQYQELLKATGKIPQAEGLHISELLYDMIAQDFVEDHDVNSLLSLFNPNRLEGFFSLGLVELPDTDYELYDAISDLTVRIVVDEKNPNLFKMQETESSIMKSLIYKTQEERLEWKDANRKSDFQGNTYYHIFYADMGKGIVILEANADRSDKKRTYALDIRKNGRIIRTMSDVRQTDKLYTQILTSNQKHDWDHEYTEVVIEQRDFIVLHNVRACTNKDHDIEEITALVRMINKKGETETAKVMAGYCCECDRYYILMEDFRCLVKRGNIMCRVIDETRPTNNHSGTGGYSNCNEESILTQMGYSVSQKRGLTNIQRKRILESLADSKILTTSQICSHLDWLIHERRSRPNFDTAVSKWEEDRDHIMHYIREESRKVGVNKLRIYN